MDITKGLIVIAKAGKEKGRKLVIIDYNNQYCMLCDGKKRPLENPKRKNYRHIALTRTVLTGEEIATNRALRKALRSVPAEPDLIPVPRRAFSTERPISTGSKGR